MSRLNIAIRTNGGVSFGLGHVRRCLALAQFLSKLGANVQFIVNTDSLVRSLIYSHGFKAVSVRLESDVQQTQDVLRCWDARVVVTDGYSFVADYLDTLREDVEFLIAIDDLGLSRVPADMVVNTLANASACHYSSLPHTRFLIGPRYTLLREEFVEVPTRRIHERVGRVLITIGGSDPLNLMPQLRGGARESLGEIELDVVVGPFFENIESIEQEAVRFADRVRVHHDPKGMQPLMVAADIAIAAGGQTSFELAATGTPAVAICLAENQHDNLVALAADGTLVLGGNAQDSDLRFKVIEALRMLSSNRDQRMRMSARGRQVVDGMGAQRVAEAIIEEYFQKRARH